MSNVPSSSDRDGTGPHSPGASSSYRHPLHRSTSVSSAWSDAPHHNQGTSYFPPASPAPRRPPTRSISAARSLSVNDEADQEDEDSGDSTPPEVRGDPPNNNGSPDERNDDAENGATGSRQYTEDDPLTVKDRQSLMNVDHPFGLPIWKPALYKKSRTVNRNAETALHATPSAHGDGLFHPGNIAWTVLFGSWLAAVCMIVSAILFLTPFGGKRYAPLIYGLGWYILWPFGKYVEGFSEDEDDFDRDVFSDEFGRDDRTIHAISEEDEEQNTPRVLSPSATVTGRNIGQSTNRLAPHDDDPISERTPFIQKLATKSYGTIPTGNQAKLSYDNSHSSNLLGRAVFWLLLTCLVAPLMLLVCLICWFLVITIPMAKLNWALIKHMFQRPDTIRFCAAPPAVFVSQLSTNGLQADDQAEEGSSTPTRHTAYTGQNGRLSAGQAAPFGSPSSTILLCTYRAIGFQYYKYTVGGVNIFFVNLMAVVFFAIIDGFVLLPVRNKYEQDGRAIPALLDILTGKALIFIVSLTSVIPLSYFIGMAVASISAQSSIGMGAVINATFGSIIEIILYAIALTQGKGHLVEGSIVGSLLAGVLLMPGVSMCSGAVRKKEQKFNAKSAGVTSTMLIMAIIGTLTPTLFYQTYGNFQLICDGCPTIGITIPRSKMPWVCDHCYYEHPDPVYDPFYQTTVKELMFFCAAILLFSYLIGLWFSLRTHASQIWQNPQPLMHPLEISVPTGQGRMSIYNRLLQSGLTSSLPTHRLGRKASDLATTDNDQRQDFPSRSQTPVPRDQQLASGLQVPPSLQSQPPSPSLTRRFQQSPSNPPGSYTPFFESVNHAVKSSGMQPMQFPENLTTDDFTRAVAVATVSALRHQQAYSHSPARARGSALGAGEIQEDSGGHGGHDAPSWSRTTSASVLLACTALYAAIAEILVDVVDVVLEGSGIDEKFLGLTLFALVPNTTEFMNAVSFAMNGNIALSMEIGSAYALQVCLLQIPAMVAFSAWYDPREMGTVANTFTLIFPRWDVIAIILSIFLLTYTYIEAKSNYHRGSILILSYVVLVAGFYYAPQRPDNVDDSFFVTQDYSPSSIFESIRLTLASVWRR